MASVVERADLAQRLTTVIRRYFSDQLSCDDLLKRLGTLETKALGE